MVGLGSFSIDTKNLVKPLFETIQTNHVRKSLVMMQMLFIFGQDFPAGYPLIHRHEKIFVREFPQFSGGCRDWIDWLIHDRNIEIQSAFHGGEKKIGPYKVDGFCSEFNTVFEFYGDYWHCHPTSFQMKTLHTQLSKIKTITP